MELDRDRFRKEIDGKQVDLYTIRNQRGMVVKITNWGAKIQQILVPDKAGTLGDVALGYDSIDQLQAGQGAMGAFIGRYANRIGQARFTLDGCEYKLAANNGANSLHGGAKGSRFVVFDARQIDETAVQMSYVFRDGEEGYPGTVPLRVVYSVSDGNELVIAYDATAVDRTTVVNFTTHAFFNLAGQGKGDVLGHVLTVNADSLHAHRCDADPDRRDQTGQGHATRLHHARDDRRAHRAGRRAAEARHRLRPQLRAGQAWRRVRLRRSCPRADLRPRHGGLVDGARPAALFRQPSRRQGAARCRQGWRPLYVAHWILLGATALPGTRRTSRTSRAPS